MNPKNALIYYLFFSFCLSKGFSQTLISNTLDEVFITSSRFELSKDNIGRVIDKITSDDIQKNSGQSLAQLLNRMTGITVNGSYGQSGSVVSTNVRGGQNRQVLILIDGIPVNDPSQIENNFDLNLMSLEYIESIEVLKGPSSVLYGTNASTAVINILTKSGYAQPFSVSINTLTGTNKDSNQNKIALDDYKTSLAIVGSHNKLNYTGHYSHRSNGGLSTISPENLSEMYNTDKFETNSLQFKLGYTFSNRFTLSGFLNLNRYTSDYDESFGFLDANNHTKNNQLRLGLNSQIAFKKGRINFNAAWHKNNRHYDSNFPTKFDAQTLNLEVFYKNRFHSKFYTVLGIKYNTSRMNSYQIPFEFHDFKKYIDSYKANDTNVDSYAYLVWISDFGFTCNTGLRLNHHSIYGSHIVYSFNPSLIIKLGKNNLQLMTSYGTSFISPSLYQLFAPSFGNMNLDPQQDATLEFGMGWSSPKSFEWVTTYFHRNQMNYIDYVIIDPLTFVGEYQNISGKTVVQGIESTFKFKRLKSFQLEFNHAFIESKNKTLFRIPKHKINVKTAYQFSKHFRASLDYQYTGKRVTPQIVNSESIVMGSYNLFGIGLRQELGNNWIIFARCSNIFNEKYEEVYRFNSLGRNYYLGFNLKI